MSLFALVSDVLTLVVTELDVESLLAFRQGSRKALALVDNSPLYQQLQALRRTKYSNDSHLIRACQMGNLELVKFFYAQSHRQNESLEVEIKYMLTEACREGHFPVARWMADCPEMKPKLLRKSRFFSWACESGNRDFIEWLRPLTEERIGVRMLIHVCRSGQLSTAQWFHSLNPTMKICFLPDEFDCGLWMTDGMELVRSSIYSGQLSMVQWALSLVAKDLNPAAIQSIFATNAARGTVEIGQWLWATYPGVDLNPLDQKNCPFGYAFQFGNFPVIQWLYSISEPYICRHYAIQGFGMHSAVNHRDLEMMQWLYDTFPEVDWLSQLEIAIETVCRNNQFEILEWIYQRYPTINLRGDHDAAFFASVHPKDFRISRWLYAKDPTIDLSRFYSGLGSRAQDLPIIQMLISLDPSLKSIPLTHLHPTVQEWLEKS